MTTYRVQNPGAEHRFLVEVWYKPALRADRSITHVPEDDGLQPDEVHVLDERCDVEDLISHLRHSGRSHFRRVWVFSD